jgi:hypothetical protein
MVAFGGIFEDSPAFKVNVFRLDSERHAKKAQRSSFAEASFKIGLMDLYVAPEYSILWRYGGM